MKNKINKCLLALFVMLAVAFAPTKSEAAAAYLSITMPFTTIIATNAATFATYQTNLANGWSTTNYTTNTPRLWDSATAAFISTTNITTNISTSYANFQSYGKDYVGLQSEFSSTGAGSNAVYRIARSTTGGRYDDLNNINVTNTASARTNTGVAQIDMRGFRYGRIVGVQWACNTNDGVNTFTNLGISYPQY